MDLMTYALCKGNNNSSGDGGSDNNFFVVKFSWDPDIGKYTSTKTFEEIVNADNEKKFILARNGNGSLSYDMTFSGDGETLNNVSFRFAGISYWDDPATLFDQSISMASDGEITDDYNAYQLTPAQ